MRRFAGGRGRAHGTPQGHAYRHVPRALRVRTASPFSPVLFSVHRTQRGSGHHLPPLQRRRRRMPHVRRFGMDRTRRRRHGASQRFAQRRLRPRRVFRLGVRLRRGAHGAGALRRGRHPPLFRKRRRLLGTAGLMRVPLGWLRDYVELPADANAVAEMLALLGFPVAAIEARPIITGVIAGRIAELGKHPNADRLQVGRIDVGDGTPLTIATAATNVAAGQTIAVATIGARLPQLTIERRKMRGLESEGMMISADELALPAEWFEDGIMQFEESLQPGTDIVELFRLSEAVLDVEITSNRVDAMSLIGLARELAAYQNVPLRTPDLSNPGHGAGGPKAQVTIESPDCRRFVSQIFTGVTSGASPAWMRIRLALAGQRPINRLIDISNYVMLETAQPLHFYDAAKFPNRHLIV